MNNIVSKGFSLHNSMWDLGKNVCSKDIMSVANGSIAVTFCNATDPNNLNCSTLFERSSILRV